MTAVPYESEKMDEWRDSLRRGITDVHPVTNLMLTGGVDDLWVNEDGGLIVSIVGIEQYLKRMKVGYKYFLTV